MLYQLDCIVILDLFSTRYLMPFSCLCVMCLCLISRASFLDIHAMFLLSNHMLYSLQPSFLRRCLRYKIKERRKKRYVFQPLKVSLQGTGNYNFICLIYVAAYACLG